MSEVDAGTEETELLSAAREGLADVFGLASVEAVTVGTAGGTLGGGGGGGAPVDDAATPAPEPITGGSGGSGERTQQRRWRGRALSDGERAASLRWPSSPSPYDVASVNLRRGQRREAAPAEAAAAEAAAAEAAAAYSAEVTAFGGGGYRARRWLQEGEDAGDTALDIDFEVALPQDEQSPASRVAAAVNGFADGGVYALADTLGVDPMDIT